MPKKIYEFVIDEDNPDLGLTGISLVENPAMESGFVAFNKTRKKFIKLQSDEGDYKQIVGGLALIPDRLIFRVSASGEEYYGYFTQETIEKLRNKFHKDLNLNNVNLEHDPDKPVPAYLVESYLLDTDDRVNEIKNKGIEEATLGAWYTAYKIEDEELFKKVLDGDVTGFSIEAYLDREFTNEALKKLNDDKNINDMKKSLVEKLKEKMNELLEEVIEQEDENNEPVGFESALVPDEGFTINWTAVGEAVTKTYTNESDEEVTEPVGQGEFVIEDGRTIVVDENSNLIEIRDAETQENEEETMSEEDKSVDKTDNGEDNENRGTDKTDVFSGDTETSDMDKKIVDLLDLTVDSEYYLYISVKDGQVQYGDLQSYKQLRLTKEVEDEIETLNKKIKELEEKLEEPISDPKLGDEKKDEVDESKLSTYEKVARRKGLPIY